MISVVVIVHNVLPRTSEIMNMTESCLQSFHNTVREDHELILIDNGSQDGGIATEILKRYSPIVIRHENNDSIAKCWNESINLAKGNFIVLINNDIIFHKPDWLTQLVSPLERPVVGVVGSKQLEWNGFKFLEGSFLAFRKDYALSLAQDGQVFDERFTFTCEDCDFCYRVQATEHFMIVAPIEDAGYATHLHHGTLAWSNEEGGSFDHKSILDVMHQSRIKLCQKYGRAERVND